MKTWQGLEAYHNGAIYSRMNGNPFGLSLDKYVLCTIPRLFTPHCANELKAADDIHQEFKDAGIPLVFASTDSPEVAEQYFGQFPVAFPFIRIHSLINKDLNAIDDFGDVYRGTFFIKEDQIIESEKHEFDSERDIWKILQKAKEIL